MDLVGIQCAKKYLNSSVKQISWNLYRELLVGGWATPLKKGKSMGMTRFPIYGKIIQMATKPPTRLLLDYWYMDDAHSTEFSGVAIDWKLLYHSRGDVQSRPGSARSWHHLPGVDHSFPMVFSCGENNAWLVVGPPLWKIWTSVGMMRFPIYGKIIPMATKPPRCHLSHLTICSIPQSSPCW